LLFNVLGIWLARFKGGGGFGLQLRSVRLHLLGLIAAAIVPVWLFAAYLLVQFALHERDRFEQEAVQTARQV
jgi:hypothetical protein